MAAIRQVVTSAKLHLGMHCNLLQLQQPLRSATVRRGDVHSLSSSMTAGPQRMILQSLRGVRDRFLSAKAPAGLAVHSSLPFSQTCSTDHKASRATNILLQKRSFSNCTASRQSFAINGRILLRPRTPQSSGRTPLACQYSSALSSSSSRKSRLAAPLEWSYLSVGGAEPLLGMTIGQVIDRARDMYGDRDAVVSMHQGIRKTFAELQRDASATAAGLLAAGLQPGDRLGIWSPNCYEWVVTQFAAAKAGLVLVNINPSYRPSELEYCLNKVSVKGIVCAASFKTSNYYSLLCEVSPELPSCPPCHLASSRLQHLSTVIMISDQHLPGTVRFCDLPSLGGVEQREAVSAMATSVQFDDPCNIQFTSGTTGLPKGAVLSHHNIVNNAYCIGARCLYQQQAHRICVSVPLYHCFGCVAGTLSGALFGATCVLPSDGFSGAACLKAIVQENVTSCYGTPTMFVDILSSARQDNIRPPVSLSTGIMAGAPCPQALVNDLMTDLNMKDFLVMYGMTETSPVTFQCYPDDPPEVRSSTIGFPADHIEVKVVDEKGRVTPVGVEGELCVRGYCVFLGYWEDQDKTREVLADDRWFRTGDLAVIDSHGYGSIRGRQKDLVIRGGENIYPAELENFFRGHPAVKEAQVFGVPDPRLGEEVAAWLRLEEGQQLTEQEFKDWCKGKIAHYKIPRYILMKDTFPVTVTGKIQKFIMRDQTVQELGLQ